MPAAAVIPAPIAYIKVVAVKTLVVEFQSELLTSVLASKLILLSLHNFDFFMYCCFYILYNYSGT